ncbi:MAG: MFS transporter [Cyanobacteria bacterium PR.3.49]|jgi:EmrB/QacA subfamily drug resistance transporter|nr:MFS transporter [Cyanobacteria bacterium PR.3.49]
MQNNDDKDAQWRPKISPEKRWTVFGSLMLVMLLAAMDQTIVSTAMPRIIGELNGLDHYSWVATSYMLLSTVSLPLYAKLSDIMGRKTILLFGVVVFLLGSIFCGLAQTMTQLIVARGFQGIGAGALLPIVMATMGDMFSPRERGRYQGFAGAVFAFASVAGPFLGGWITDHTHWRWVFFINLPLGAIAMFALIRLMPSYTGARWKDVKIDFVGAAFLVTGLTSLLLGFTWAGVALPWSHPLILGLFGTFAFSLAGFIITELKVHDPILEMRLFRNPIVLVSFLVTMLTNVAMMSGVFFLPLFMQEVLGQSASDSGTVMTPMMFALVIASTISGQFVTRTGRYKRNAMVGSIILVAGTVQLLMLGIDSTMWNVTLAMITMGFGLGISSSLYTTVVQNAVSFKQMGQATGAVTLFRQIGGTVGLAIFGSLVNTTSIAGGKVAFAAALHQVFIGVVIVAAIAMVVSWFLKEIPLQQRSDDSPPPGH